MALEIVRQRDTLDPKPIDVSALACHTAVLAQSGSGKSFLVGRVIEEIVLKTKARVLVLDPNSDFVRLPEVDSSAWTKPALKPWFFPTDTAAAFRAQWTRAAPVVLSNRNIPGARSVRIDWGGLTDRERAAAMDIDAITEPELYWTLVLTSEIARERWQENDEPHYDFEFFRTVANEVCDFILTGDDPTDIAQKPLALSLRTGGPRSALRFRALIYSLEDFEIWRAVGDDENDVAEILQIDPHKPSATVIDLLSLGTEAERLAVTSRAIAAVWKSAREEYSAALRDDRQPDRRVPTIVVIDEAHNLIPFRRTSPAAERVAADLTTIAAEGRKFGLFLLLITQRPRKLDTSVLSECDSLFLMRMTNDTDIQAASEIFGFLDADIATQTKTLKVGEVFLQGRLSGASTVWHVAPRRTMQGGKNLDEAYWSRGYRRGPRKSRRGRK